MLKFAKMTNNAKLAGMGLGAYTFSLPAGHTCPFAHDCLSKADQKTGKLTDGKSMQFRCFSATAEAIYKNARNLRWDNFEKLRRTKSMAKLLNRSLPVDAKIVRVHVSGDFFSEAYFKAWMEVARLRPDVVFYGYTKSVRYLVKHKADLPSNFRFTASFGGLEDHLIMEHGVKSALVVYHPDEAEKLGLEIDHDDGLAMKGDKSFALLLHGMQPKGSVAAKALSTMRSEKIEFSYSW